MYVANGEAALCQQNSSLERDSLCSEDHSICKVEQVGSRHPIICRSPNLYRNKITLLTRLTWIIQACNDIFHFPKMTGL